MRIQLQHFRRIVTSQWKKITAGTVIAAANPPPAANGVHLIRSYLRRPNTVVSPPPEIMFFRLFYGVNRANGSDKMIEGSNKEEDVVVKDLGGGVEVDDGVSDSYNEEDVVVKHLGGGVEVDDGVVSDSNNEDDVVSEDGEVIDGVKVSQGEDLGKSDDAASRDGEGGTEIENEGVDFKSKSFFVRLEKKIIEMAGKVSLGLGASGVDFLHRVFQNIIASEWFVILYNSGSILFTVVVGFFGAIWTLAVAFEYGRDDLRKLLDGVYVKRISLPNGVKFEITGLKGASNITVQIIGNEILRIRAIGFGGRNIKHNLPLAKGNYQFAKREAKFDPKIGQLNIELTDFLHTIDIPVNV